ncbi:CAP domain-containing protein [Alicyclobacillus dauci]|uniref:CAP domain-containing protein n=1 Tax=Alicyclobacillus dauci TaxID=1475485 RepID=A0ABY6Z4M2_9BACL|nr:CAP domain-containing protein [Alicyclobacillus dauci]WAH37612.1 CAP domain-containing protein [Alicyclobacillus dauci]
MLKKTIAGFVVTSALAVGLAAPTFAATTSNVGSHVYTQTFTFTSWTQVNNWLQHYFQAPSTSQVSQVPVQKPVPQSTQTSVQKSVPAQQTTSNANTSVPAGVQQVVNLVNQERQKNGLAPLTISKSLDNVAQTKAQDMINENYFDHTSPKYGSPFNMMSTFGIHYTYAGENIAAGQPDAATVMKDWMNSPGHRANILDPHYTEIGVGEAHGGSYGTYWVQEFIRP